MENQPSTPAQVSDVWNRTEKLRFWGLVATLGIFIVTTLLQLPSTRKAWQPDPPPPPPPLNISTTQSEYYYPYSMVDEFNSIGDSLTDCAKKESPESAEKSARTIQEWKRKYFDLHSVTRLVVTNTTDHSVKNIRVKSSRPWIGRGIAYIEREGAKGEERAAESLLSIGDLDNSETIAVTLWTQETPWFFDDLEIVYEGGATSVKVRERPVTESKQKPSYWRDVMLFGGLFVSGIILGTAVDQLIKWRRSRKQSSTVTAGPPAT